MELIEMLLVVCPLVFFASFVDAIAGGGGLISLPAYFITGMPAHMAIASNKFSAAIGTAISTARFIKSGNLHMKTALQTAVIAFVGSALGAKIALFTSDYYLRIAMMVLKNTFALPGLWTKLCKHAKDPDSYPEIDRWNHIQKIMKAALRAGNVELIVKGMENIPEKDSPIFREIYLALQLTTIGGTESSIFHTGLLTYGNANPASDAFNSLADFMAGDGFVEIKLPWQLLNFMDPSRMMIHDDYYEHYGVEKLEIDRIYIGVGNGTEARIEMQQKKMKGWDTKVTYHERLKESYYILQSFWKQD